MSHDQNYERDKTIARVLFGWEFKEPKHGSCCTCQRCGRSYEYCQYGFDSCEFSEDIVSAMSVMRKMCDKHGWVFSMHYQDTFWEVSFDQKYSSSRIFQVQNESNPAKAICVAAMKALGYE